MNLMILGCSSEFKIRSSLRIYLLNDSRGIALITTGGLFCDCKRQIDHLVQGFSIIKFNYQLTSGPFFFSLTK